MTTSLRIDPEFQAVLPPLTHEEKSLLEQKLRGDGYDKSRPIVVWQEENVIVDGHNRYDLCRLHGIDFEVEYRSFANRDAALLWIFNEQMGRRNITEEQKSYLRGKRNEFEKKRITNQQGKNQYTEVGDQNDPQPKTAEKLAQEYGVSAPTIKRDAQFAKGVDMIAAVAPAEKAVILSGQSLLTKQVIQSFAEIPKQAAQEIQSAYKAHPVDAKKDEDEGLFVEQESCFDCVHRKTGRGDDGAYYCEAAEAFYRDGLGYGGPGCAFEKKGCVNCAHGKIGGVYGDNSIYCSQLEKTTTAYAEGEFCQYYRYEDVPVLTEAEIQAKIEERARELTKQKLAEIEAQKQREKDAKVDARRQQIAETAQRIAQENAQVDGVYDVLVIDPPWEYSERGGFSAQQHDPDGNRGGVDYPTMTLAQLRAMTLPIKSDAVVFLWTTHAFLRDAFDLLSAWGLEYKATIVWDKEKMGIGRTIRLQCEFCLLAVKGSPVLQGAAERDILREPRREHSRKPEAFYAMVNRLTLGRKLDYFGREQREGWSVYGAEATKF